MRIAMGILEAGGHMRIECTAGAAGDTVAGTAKHPCSTKATLEVLSQNFNEVLAPSRSIKRRDLSMFAMGLPELKQ